MSTDSPLNGRRIRFCHQTQLVGMVPERQVTYETRKRVDHIYHSSSTIEVEAQRARPSTSNGYFDAGGELTHGFDVFLANPKSVYSRRSLVVFLRYTQSALESSFPFCTP